MTYDVIIIGSGLAGLATALQLPENLTIAIVSKNSTGEGASRYAQGGIAAGFTLPDSNDNHIADTLKAGQGLCDLQAVDFTIKNCQTAIKWLESQGVRFTQTTSGYHLMKEGGHSHRRVFHIADSTGKAIMQVLKQNVQHKDHITLFEEAIGIDLITDTIAGKQSVCGVYLLCTKTHKILSLAAKAVVCATGGASKAYLFNTNPQVASGDGIAMAYRAGASVANLEFNQFHPTCLYHPDARGVLLSEAIRGEGGHLLLPDGSRFMLDIDSRAELAPRDVVAISIDKQMKKYGIKNVYLDISFKDSHFITSHFPMLYKECLKYGYDMTQQALPVVPAAHYTCGGIKTNLSGQTDILHLYAVGEAACTGLHGANRLASNSLLECIVFATSTAKHISEHLSEPTTKIPSWDSSNIKDAPEAVLIQHNWMELRQCMWNYVGIVRNKQRLKRALTRVTMLLKEIDDYYQQFTVSYNLLELRNMALVASLIVRSAQFRQESRGLHINEDYPDKDDVNYQGDTLINKAIPYPLIKADKTVVDNITA